VWTLPVNALEAQPASSVSFYFAAHQDDWQLFMNPAPFEQVVEPSHKAVFIHMTAGDAGLGLGSGGRKHPLYLARENGAEAAVRFMAEPVGTTSNRTATHMEVNGHAIFRVAYRNTVSYFLRLPDGSPHGTGYSNTGFQSLKRLTEGQIETISAIDGSANYRGWADLTGTLRAIIDFERGGAPSVQLHVAEMDERVNPGDHSDHLVTAKAALEAAGGLTCARRFHYVDYASSKLPENLNAQQRDMEGAVFAVTLAGVLALDHQTAWQRYNHWYVGRNYFRVEEGKGSCAPATSGVSLAKR
jgi:hypothetical protein